MFHQSRMLSTFYPLGEFLMKRCKVCNGSAESGEDEVFDPYLCAQCEEIEEWLGHCVRREPDLGGYTLAACEMPVWFDLVRVLLVVRDMLRRCGDLPDVGMAEADDPLIDGFYDSLCRLWVSSQALRL